MATLTSSELGTLEILLRADDLRTVIMGLEICKSMKGDINVRDVYYKRFLELQQIRGLWMQLKSNIHQIKPLFTAALVDIMYDNDKIRYPGPPRLRNAKDHVILC